MIADDRPLFRGTLLRLTAARPEDAEVMAAWSEDSEYARLVDTDFARPRSAASMAGADSMPTGAIEFRLRLLEDDRLIGFVALHSIEWNNGCCMVSIGVGSGRDRGKGHGCEAMQLALNYAFNELNLYRVGLTVVSYNERARRLYERLGFRHEGAARGFGQRAGQRYDLLYMGLLRDEWLASQE